MSKVSIIIPIYNVEDYLAKCLQSCLDQSYRDLEILCVNDGSPDNCQSIIEEFEKKDSRVKGLIKENGGLSDARNFGLERAGGEWFFFLDSDDSLTKDAIEVLMKKAEETGADLVMGGFREMSYTGQLVREVVNAEFAPCALKDMPQLLHTYPHCAWNKLYHASLFMKTGIRFPKGLYYEDVGTSPLIMLEAEKIAYVAYPLVNYLVDRPGNITQSVNKKVREILEELEIVNSHYRQKGVFETFREELCYFNISMVFDNLWKMKLSDDDEYIKKFFDDSYAFLDENFENWRKSAYFREMGFARRNLLTMKDAYRLYLKRSGK